MRIVSIGSYFGGKAQSVRKILPWLPSTCDRYLEPFGGLFSVGLNRRGPRVYNDLNPRTVNLLRQIRDNASALEQSALGSDRSLDALKACWEVSQDPLEDARRYYWVCASRFAGGGTRWDTGISTASWANCQRHRPSLALVAQRLQGVEIRQDDALTLLLSEPFNRPGTLTYIDPPYTWAERGSKDKRRPHSDRTSSQYAVEVDQAALLDVLTRFQGMAVVSGRPNALYDEALTGWPVVEFSARDGSRARATERLWLNPAAWTALDRQLSLLEVPC